MNRRRALLISEDNYLTFIAQENGTFSFTSSISSNTISYSTNGGLTWTTPASSVTTSTITATDKVLWKGDMTPISESGIGTFSSSGRFIAEGTPMSLLYNDNFRGQIDLTGKDCAFMYLFSGCTGATSVENLSLPATTLVKKCYYEMFSNCTSLTTAPELPATTLMSGSYASMFKGCTSLTAAPELPATTLESNCYYEMFSNCTSLTTAPSILPATTLMVGSYASMFKGCTSLTAAPELPATTVAGNSCSNMFAGCTSLTTAPSILPATTLDSVCYGNMFMDCTSLTTAPVLPATTLVRNCYLGMFARCSNLNYIKAMFTTTPSTAYTGNWVLSGATSGTFVMNSAASWNTGTTACGKHTYPCNWTVETASS